MIDDTNILVKDAELAELRGVDMEFEVDEDRAAMRKGNSPGIAAPRCVAYGRK
jgi:hypothetical protein